MLDDSRRIVSTCDTASPLRGCRPLTFTIRCDKYTFITFIYTDAKGRHLSERPGRHQVAPIDFAKEPFKLGVLTDLPGTPGLTDVWVDGLRLALEYCAERKLIDRPVELVIGEVLGQPWRAARNVVEAWNELVDEGVLGIAGPMSTDNSLEVLGEVERRGIPTMTICGSQQYVGESAFNLSNGGMADEPVLMAAWLAAEGYRRVAVMYDSPSQIGAEYLHYFLLSAGLERLEICAQIAVSPTPSQDDMDTAVARAKTSGAEALSYLFLGNLESQSKLKPAFAKADWDPPRVMTTGFVGAAYNDEMRSNLDGWTGVDQVHEANSVFEQVLALWDKRYGYRPFNSAASCSWDIGHAFGIALGRMRTISPRSLGRALETVRRLPAASGGPGTIITFGPQDHRGYKGADFLVLRHVCNDQYKLTGTVPVVLR